MTTLVRDPGRNTPARLASSAILACQPDQRLVELVRSGHERAFDAIVERYRGQLVRYCWRILPESRCEDAVQQAFVNAHAALIASDEPIQLKAWLFAIARNAALNMLRQNGWNYEQIPLDFDGVRRPDQVFEQRIELEQTVAALRDLPERQRDALVMREFEGRSYEEIAVALGTADGAVRQLLNRARATLRSAASALIPWTLVERAASAAAGGGGGMAQIVGGLGAVGVAKAGATALIAGSLVIGVANAPLPIGESHETTREKATLTTGTQRAAARASDGRAIALPGQGLPVPGSGTGRAQADGRGSESNRSGSARHDSSGRSGSDDGGRSRGGTHSGSGSGSGEGGSGSGDSRSGAGSNSSGRDTQGSGDRSGTSGDGSGDSAATVVRSDGVSGGSGSSGPGSGSSGSGSGSGEIASSGEPTLASSSTGSSGSGSSDSSSGSGSDSSGASGTGSSGSGSSGSDDLLDH